MTAGNPASGSGDEPTAGPPGYDSKACAYTSYEPGDAPEEYPKTGDDAEGVAREVWDALYEVEDPEMPVSVVDLGLIYDVHVEPVADDGESGDGDDVDADEAFSEAGVRVVVEMTLTYSGCPARDMLTNDVRCAAETPAAVSEADVRLRYTPEWSVDMVTDRGRADLREFGLSV